MAGKGKSAKLALQISERLKEIKIEFEVYDVDWPLTLDNISEAWIVGGDGTLNFFLNRYKKITLPIAVFKGGTGNDFAWKLYGDMDLQQQIKNVLTHETKAIDAAECNGQIFINGIGIGFDGEVVKSIKTIRFLGGHLGYLWAVLKNIVLFKEQRYQIIFNDEVFAERFLLVIIANSSRTGGGFIVSPLSDIADGKLNLILCKPLNILKRIQNLPLLKKGKHLHKKFIFHKETSRVKILCEEVVFGHLDGELISGKLFNISILPKRFFFKY